MTFYDASCNVLIKISIFLVHVKLFCISNNILKEKMVFFI